MLFSKRNNTEATPKRRSTLVTLLSPGFGNSIRPIGENTRVFVNLIAMLFAMQGLFPKNHAAFANGGNNPQARLTLHEIIATAWSNLSFTEKGMPQVLFFFAVVASMALVVLAVVVVLFSLLIGTAHAQTPGTMFTPPQNDLAQNWIDYLFNGGQLSTAYSQNGNTIPQTFSIQCSLMTVLGYYSDAVLMVAALILFYHLASMVVETAHHGVVMGKRANQVWAPIRLVVAVGLLVPLGGTAMSTCTSGGTGLNSAQYITIKIAEMGSALASNTWTKFIQTLGNTPYNLIPPPVSELDGIVAGMMASSACMSAWNHFVNAGGLTPSSVITDPVTDSSVRVTDAGGTHYPYSVKGVPAYEKVCGEIYIPSASTIKNNNSNLNDFLSQPVQPSTVPDTIGTNMTSVSTSTLQTIDGWFNSGSTPVNSVPSNYIIPFIPEWNYTANNDNPPPNNAIYETEVETYANALTQGISNAVSGAQNPLNTQVVTSGGWIAAGAWTNVISRDQGAIISAAQDNLPKITPPKFAPGIVGTDTQNAVTDFSTWLTQGYAAGAAPASPCAVQGASGGAGKVKGDETGSPTLMILGLIDKWAVSEELWHSENFNCPTSATPSFSLGTQFGSANPLGELTAFGHKSIHLAMKSMDMMLFSMAGQLAGSLGEGFAAGLKGDAATNNKFQEVAAALALPVGGLATIAKSLGGIGAAAFGFLATVFITIGVTLGYIVPLIPFVHFLFATVAWGLVLLEAIIAMPLVALAHLNPEGDGLPGGMAKQAYFLLFGLFMRPVMYIFGLIVSLLIFFFAMILLNKLFATTVIGTGGMGQGYATFSRIIYTVIYVFLAYTCAINCFKIIDSMPEAVFRWISINIQHQRIADGGSTLQSAGPLVAGYAGGQAIGAIQSMGNAGAGAATAAGQVAGAGANKVLGALGGGGTSRAAPTGAGRGTTPPALPAGGGGTVRPGPGGGTP